MGLSNTVSQDGRDWGSKADLVYLISVELMQLLIMFL